MISPIAKFAPGDLVYHRLFGYRGVVVDVDSEFSGSDQWYDEVAKTQPPKDQPWYKVLVDNKTHQTYVAERNLQADSSNQPIIHPMVMVLFSEFSEGRYLSKVKVN